MHFRWMQKKDLDKFSDKNKNDFLELISYKNVVANVVETEGKISGWIIYQVFKDFVKISKIGFRNEEVAEFMINKLKSKKGKKTLEIIVSEYDLRMQLLLKDLNFTLTNTSHCSQSNVDLYKFLF